MLDDKYEIDYNKPLSDGGFKPHSLNYANIITEYEPEYCQAIIEHGQQGKSVESFAGREGIDPDALTLWCEDHAEFRAASKISLCAQYYYWEQLRDYALNNPMLGKDMLPTINRMLSMIESTLTKNGLRKSAFTYEEEDPINKNRREDEAAFAAMEGLG